RIEEEAHSAPAHTAKHPEAPEIFTERGASLCDERMRVEISGPGNNGLEGAIEVLLGAGADGAYIAALQMPQHFVEDADGLFAAAPLGLRTQEIFFGD